MTAYAGEVGGEADAFQAFAVKKDKAADTGDSCRDADTAQAATGSKGKGAQAGESLWQVD